MTTLRKWKREPVLLVLDSPPRPILNKQQARRRLKRFDVLRDIRVGGAVWAAADEELNENGRAIMRELHSPIMTLQAVWVDPEFGPRLRTLVREYLKAVTE